MTQKSRLLVLVDEANITRAASKNFRRNFDWNRFRDYLETGVGPDRSLVEMIIYAGLPPSTPEWTDKREAKRHYIHWLRSQGFMVYEKIGQPRINGWYKAYVDVIMAIDALDLSQRIRPDIVTLVTGGADFAHLAMTLRRDGIRVEVASVPQTLSSELKTAASSVIDLSELFLSFEPFEYNENDPINLSEDYY